MTLNDAVSNNIFNLDGAEFRITVERNGNVVEEFTGNLGYVINFDDVYADLMVDSGVISGISSFDCVENLHDILRKIVRCCEDCDFDFLAENLDKMFYHDSDGTIYQFFVDVYGISMCF